MSCFSSLFGILAVAVGLSAAATCPARDNDGSPLLSSSNDGSFVTCVYQAARTCIYFENGDFSSGSSVCPSSIPARRALVERDAVCSATDDNGSPLLSSSDDGNFVTCVYRDAGTCTYFENGSFSSGSSVCPDSISVVATATCPPEDNDGGALLNTSNDGNFVSCDYADAGLCTYFEDGGFSSGSSVCPSSIPAKRSIASAKFGRAYKARA
ncbi:uncharacterized protein BT62DRAFT_999108 [Guyanagaster necrorhizus]|uniref:Uncharacterized protein n=1 Tax=Guyanagaster necrorhizus TaxID=856835 RepID=A0A9P7W6C4_9AGAR|nr:uncharacterized protein BT62DRAFT_999108 [Guyanagaster necrorhizus MCA 3950]KAG7453074.1 hypothetical protein BT62DRAFT_999108 [Guyanagaster necrorhizus MCA 3950]